MNVRRFRISLPAVLASTCFVLACESLTLPPQAQPEAQTTTTVTPGVDGGDASVVVVTTNTQPTLIPAGAVLGEVRVPKWGGGATIQSWAILDAAGKVQEVSWTLPVSLLNLVNGSTADLVDFSSFPPIVGEQTFVQSLGIDYRHAGHSPVGVYDLPHFEFHIASISAKELSSINCEKGAPKPSPDQIPASVVMDPPPLNCISQMGVHGYNHAEPEFNGEKFSKGAHLTYYFDNKDVPFITSFEVKATMELLFQRGSFEFTNFNLLRPEKVGRVTTYPTKLSATFKVNEDLYVYTLSGFEPVSQ